MIQKASTSATLLNLICNDIIQWCPLSPSAFFALFRQHAYSVPNINRDFVEAAFKPEQAFVLHQNRSGH